MKTRTVTVREGEYLGPVDWSYDFMQHFKNHPTPHKACADAVETLKRLSEKPEAFLATTDGGWPRFGWKPVLKIGMYDGWPHWKPVPSVLYDGTLGPEWHSFYSITGIEKRAH